MAAAPVEEKVSQDSEADRVFERPKGESKSVANLIEEIRAVSTNSLKELDEVNQYLEKLEKDVGMWNKETDDPILTFDLENLRQAFRETITLSGRYKAACKSLEHYLLKLEEHAGAVCAVQSGVIEDKLTETADDNEPLLDYVARCIARCFAHVDEYGSKYSDLNTKLCEIIDKYCTPPIIKEQHGPHFLLSLLCQDTHNGQNLPLQGQQAELDKAKQMVTTVVKNSKIIKKRWTKLNKLE